MTTLELREQRANLLTEVKGILDLIKSEDRAFSQEEETKYDDLMAKSDILKNQIERTEKLELAERSLSEPSERVSKPLVGSSNVEKSRIELEDEAFRSFLLTGETRDLILANDSKGGYTVKPVTISDRIIGQVDEMVHVRKLATIHKLTDAKAIGIPKLVSSVEATWGATEIGPNPAGSGVEFGQVLITPELLQAHEKVSIRLIQSNPSIDSYVRNLIAKKFSAKEEEGFMTGDGSGKPLGMFTADNDGIPTSRDFVVATGTTITTEKLVNATYELSEYYLNKPTTGWLMHGDVIARLRLLNNQQNGMMWESSLAQGQPDRFLGIPVYRSSYAPNTFASGAYIGILGDFSEYHIVETQGVEVQQLRELYAATHEVGLVARTFVNGNPGDPNAFLRLKLGNV